MAQDTIGCFPETIGVVAPDGGPLVDSRQAQYLTLERYRALESLWSAIKDKDNWKLGYNPALSEAVKALEELEKL